MNAALASCSHKDDRRNDRRERGGRPNPWLIHGRLFRADSESLECRRLLTSVSFNVGTGALLVTGDSTADTISIETVSGTIKVWDTTDDAVNPLWTRSPESDVQTIVVSAGGGADTVTVQGSVSSSIETTLKGEAGNDTLTGGRGDDRLEGGADNDTYKFTGSSDLSSTAGDYVVEASIAGTDNSVDVLDFSGFANGLDELDLADAVNVQHVALTDVSPTRPSLHLKLSDGNGIENVIGSEANAG